jgi:hypothetical protein
MKYMLLIYNNPESLPAEELQGLMDEATALMGELVESGEWVGGEALAEPAKTRTVRMRDGVVAATDGPFAEAKEQLAGYCVVECESLERATEIAMRWPDARYGAMEVRPILEVAGPEA